MKEKKNSLKAYLKKHPCCPYCGIKLRYHQGIGRPEFASCDNFGTRFILKKCVLEGSDGEKQDVLVRWEE